MTPLGLQIVEFLLVPVQSKMLIASVDIKCSSDCLVIVTLRLDFTYIFTFVNVHFKLL